MPTKNKKEIEIVNGRKGDLKISSVKKHLEVEKPHSTPDKNKIIIPYEKNQKK